MRNRLASQGFALPTVIITSVVLFAVMVAAVGMVSSTSASLNAQYFENLAADAAESGAVRAGDCIRRGVYSIGTSIKPSTSCSGGNVSGQSLYELSTPTYRTTYLAKVTSSSGQAQTVEVTGTVQQMRNSGVVFSTHVSSRKVKVEMVLNPDGDRASQRYWYFGNRIIFDFGADGNDLPIIKYNAASSSPQPNASEGTTVVSDSRGDLQFWSNGMTLWNQKGNIMQNGSGLNGAPSAVQAVASFPMNSSRTKYGVVSNSGQAESGAGQLYLSIVDLTFNGGDGKVTTLNQPLGSGLYADEGLGSMPNADGTGYYVFAYDALDAKVTSFLIKVDGSVQGPFITNLNPAPRICDPFGYSVPHKLTGYGSFNFTKDYGRMVLLVGTSNCPGNVTGTAYLFGTNLNNGALTMQASWTTNAANVGNGYSADFSPNETYVYVSSIYPGNLTRYNIQNLSTIPDSEWQIGYVTNETSPTGLLQSGGQVRRGPDGRMYMSDHARVSTGARPCYVSYIDNPDATTNTNLAIGLQPDGLTMPSGSGACSTWGLPQMATVFEPRAILY